jgi:type I restriction enzyme M protein
MIEADLVDCMVALPGQLFFSTQIPVCLWFIARDKRGQPSSRPSAAPLPLGEGSGGEGRFRDRRGETLFIDARKLGTMVDRTHLELTEVDAAKIAGTYHAWRGDEGVGEYVDLAGFCKSAKLDEIRKHGHVLTPGRYVGAEAAEDDGEPFDEKMKRLTAALENQFDEARGLEDAIQENLRRLGFGESRNKRS